MLELEDLHAFYGRSHIVQGISLSVAAGEGVALVGHNGVGKTTTLRAIMGSGPRTSGGLTFAGRPLRGAAHRRARAGLGFVPDAEAVFPDMTVDENIRAAALVHGGSAVATAYELFPVLRERRQQLAGTLSGGEQKALTLARGLALKPKLIMVDEPSEGLMPRNVDLIAEALRKAIADGIGVLVVDASFHLLKTVCSRLYVMKQGRLTGHHSMDEFSTPDSLVAKWIT